MKILILGAGMYVTGRNQSGNGTVLSSLIQLSKKVLINEIVIIAKKKSNLKIITDQSKKIKQILSSSIDVRYKAIREKSDLKAFCLNEKFDCGIIVTPDHTHYELIKLLMDLKIHVLCVKPLVSSIKENKELIKLQMKNNVIGIVEFHKRYDDANLYTKKIIQDKLLGEILYYHVDYSQRISIPRDTFKSWVEHTNIFQYLGVHYVDLFYFFTNYKPIKLYAYGTSGSLKNEQINSYDSIHVSIIWETNENKECITTFNTNWIDPECTSALSDQKYKIVGTKGRIENDHKNRGIEFVSDTQQIQHPNPYFSEYLLNPNNELEFGGYAHKSISRFILDVMDFVAGKINIKSLENIRPTFSQSLISTTVNEYVKKSLINQSRWVTINDYETKL